MEKYHELSTDTVELFEKIWSNFYLPKEIKYSLLGNNKLKTAIKINRLNDLNKHLLNKEIVFELNEDYLYKIDETSVEILIVQELTKINLDLDKGKLNLATPDVITFASVINKYGSEEVINANQLIKLLHLQEEEAKKEAKAATATNKKGKKSKSVVASGMKDTYFSN